jgi:alkaline phosphatase D
MRTSLRHLFDQKITKRGFIRMMALAGSLLPTLPLLSSKSQAQVNASQLRVLQGPMLGAVTPTSIRIWVRVSNEFPVSVAVSESPQFDDTVVTPPVLARAEDDLTVTLLVSDLRPATRYYYRILVDGRRGKYTPDVPVLSFVTAPDPKTAAVFSVATGSCARFAEDPDQVVWRSVAAASPDFFIWLGDNIYGDSGQPSTLNGEYQRQRDVITYRPVSRQIPQIAIWDDHDSGLDNGDGSSSFKYSALKSFRNYWANPAYGLDDTPGVFFEYHYGGVDFFLLDGRYYRDPNAAPDVAGKTMLGAAQKAWLKERLRASKAPFKIIATGGGWTVSKGPGGDSWASFLTERDELFDFIRDERIDGVVLISGDSHVAELNAIPRSEKGGYDLYDLVSSPLAQDASDGFLERRPERRIRQVYFGSANFGLLQFDMRGKDPWLEFNVLNYRGDAAWEPFRLYASELVNGKSTWLDKMDELSRTRYESAENGGEYYQPLPVFRQSPSDP